MIPTRRALDENVFYILAAGPNIDAERAAVDKEYFFACVRRLSSNPALQFGEVKSLYSYRWVYYLLVWLFVGISSQLTASLATYYRPNNFRTVETYRKGRVFVAGGMLLSNASSSMMPI